MRFSKSLYHRSYGYLGEKWCRVGLKGLLQEVEKCFVFLKEYEFIVLVDLKSRKKGKREGMVRDWTGQLEWIFVAFIRI